MEENLTLEYIESNFKDSDVETYPVFELVLDEKGFRLLKGTCAKSEVEYEDLYIGGTEYRPLSELIPSVAKVKEMKLFYEVWDSTEEDNPTITAEWLESIYKELKEGKVFKDIPERT